MKLQKLFSVCCVMTMTLLPPETDASLGFIALAGIVGLKTFIALKILAHIAKKDTDQRIFRSANDITEEKYIFDNELPSDRGRRGVTVAEMQLTTLKSLDENRCVIQLVCISCALQSNIKERRICNHFSSYANVRTSDAVYNYAEAARIGHSEGINSCSRLVKTCNFDMRLVPSLLPM